MELLNALQVELKRWEAHHDDDIWAWNYSADWRYVQVKHDRSSNSWEFKLHTDSHKPASSSIRVVDSVFSLDNEPSTAAACRQHLESFIE